MHNSPNENSNDESETKSNTHDGLPVHAETDASDTREGVREEPTMSKIFKPGWKVSRGHR